VLRSVILVLAAAAAAPATILPNGAKLEPSGFLTIETVPPTPTKPVKRQPQPGGEVGWYARERNISEEEARQRIAE